ncbi:MAG: hypothetical protein KJ915_11830 [Candidatus Omnitrophica bacterium]|nr:hypothetical protein [Candidatus Omnitrophota bacterium]
MMKQRVKFILCFILLLAANVYAAEQNLDADRAYNQGVDFYSKLDYNKAEENFLQSMNTQDKRLEQWSAYNLGNAFFKQAQTAEQSDPASANQTYQKALDFLKRAIELDPEDKDAKYNYELTAKKIIEQKQKDQQQNQKDKQQNQKDKQQNEKDKQQDQKDQQQDKQEKQDQQKNQDQENQQDKQEKQDQQDNQEQKDQQDKQNAKASENQQDKSQNASQQNEQNRQMTEQEAKMLLDNFQQSEDKKKEMDLYKAQQQDSPGVKGW